MEIPEATEDDAKRIQELVIGLSHFYLSINDDTVPGCLLSTLTLKEFEKRIKCDRYTNLVCKSNENIIGYISVKDKSHIYHLFVALQYQKKGIAKLLWKSAMEVCKATRYTVRSSLYAVPVYQRFGFKKVCRRRTER